jgi:hypothetical protein
VIGGEPVAMVLYSRKNIVGSILALTGLGLYFVGAIQHFWLPIVVGMYGIGYFATPQPPVLSLGEPTVGQSPEEIKAALARLVGRVRDLVEPDVLARITSIVSSINDTLPLLVRGGANMDATLFTVRQMAVDYLPGALESYLKLPKAYRTRRTLEGGQTAKDALQDQLALLDGKMQEVLVSVHENDVQALLANGRFLKEKFAPPTFKVGAV